MKYLFTTIPGLGHFHPLIPLANALKERGHDVVFCSSPRFASVVKGRGFKHIPAGLDWDEGDLLGTMPEIKNVPLLSQGEWILKEIFMKRAPLKMIPDLTKIIKQQKPDALIVTTYEVGGMIAAELEGVPYVNFNISFTSDRNSIRFLYGPFIANLRRIYELPQDKTCLYFGKYLNLSTFSEDWSVSLALNSGYLKGFYKSKFWKSSFSEKLALLKSYFIFGFLRKRMYSPALEKIEGALVAFKDGEVESESSKEDWMSGMPEQPTIFGTLGTTFNSLYPELLKTVIDAFKGESLNLILAVGRKANLKDFGDLPANIVVKDYVPQNQIMKHVDALICHGGPSTVMESLKVAKPVLIFPLSADHPFIAQICCELGVTIPLPYEVMQLDSLLRPVINPDKITPELLRGHVKKMLGDESLKQSCLAFQEKMKSLTSIDAAVTAIESVNK